MKESACNRKRRGSELSICIYSAATKTYLRSSMSEQRLTDLAVLSIERDISDSLDLENVVDAFAQKHKNSRIVLT